MDLAAGTGIFTRQLLAAGFEVSAVEPNAAMRAASGLPMRAGTAEATGLDPDCADLVCAAQAFHWFELDAALAEIGRILAPGGLAVAVWNLREPSPFNERYDALLWSWSADYREVAKGGPTLDRLRRARPSGEPLAFGHGQSFDWEGLRGRAWSSSYVRHGVADAAGFDAALAELFAAHAVGGRVEMAYATRGWAWR